MKAWVVKGLRDAGHEVAVVEPEDWDRTQMQQSAKGQFLNWAQRVAYATAQVSQLAAWWHDVKEGDRILIGDLWHPGLSGLRYLSFTTSKRVGVFAVSYAGPFDPDDFLAPARGWAGMQEVAWMQQLDGCFVGSSYHRECIKVGTSLDAPGAFFELPHVTGLVWGTDEEIRALAAKVEGPHDPRPVVIWPHRIANEKRPWWFASMARRLAEEFPEVRFVISTSRVADMEAQEFYAAHNVELVCQGKPNYYRMMRDATLMVSTAQQETWGYTLREAAALGTAVLAPTTACYPEFVPRANLYRNRGELIKRAAQHLRGDRVPALKLPEGDGEALTRMIKVMDDWQ